MRSEIRTRNLPIQLTTLHGRRREIDEVHALLLGERLVTLTGSPGVGKTRLALAVAAKACDSYAGEVWWVELSPVTEPEGVLRAVLGVLRERPGPDDITVQRLARSLGDQPCLLVIDNCEHLAAACADLVAHLLVSSPCVSVLATSRERLRVPGEVGWRVPSLASPPPDGSTGLEELSQFAAAALFLERARRSRPDLLLTRSSALAIAQICRRLDGIPLALELAAGRCSQMSPERIAVELDQRFRLLTCRDRTVSERQQTLANSIDWSYDRLDDAERATFQCLGVFAGPFPMEAAEAVVSTAADLERADVFDVVSRLVDKHLVSVEDGPHGEPRYRLLESLRAYALDRAVAHGGVDTLREAHAEWWAAWLEPRGEMPSDDALGEVAAYHADVKAALDWSAGSPARGLCLLASVGRAWAVLGGAADAMPAADRLLTEANARHLPVEWLKAAHRSSDLYFEARGQREYDSVRDSSERLATEIGDDYYRALNHWPRETEETIALQEMACDRGDRFECVSISVELAGQAAEDDPVRAAVLLREAEAAAATSGMSFRRDAVQLAKAELANSSGSLAESIRLSLEMLPRPHSANWADAVRLLSLAGLLACDEAALRAAVNAAERALWRAPGDDVQLVLARHRLGLLQGQPSIVDPLTSWRSVRRRLTNGTLWLVLREALDAGATEAAVECAHFWTRPAPHTRAIVAAIEAASSRGAVHWHNALGQAAEHGLRLVAVDALEGLAIAAAQGESWVECIRLLGAAQRLRDETGYRWRFTSEQRVMVSAKAAADTALGDQAEGAWHEGAGLDWREAAAYALRARGTRGRPSHGWASLTPTEHQVVVLVAEGLTNPQIAQRLLMGRATVKSHLEHVFAKLGVSSRAELAAEVVRQTGR